MLQEDNTSNFQQETVLPTPSHEHWRHKLYSGASSDDSSTDFKQINRGFSSEQQQPQFSSQASSNDSTITSQQNLTASYQVDSAYGLLLQSENQPNYENRPMTYAYPPASSYGADWNKFPQFLRTSPPKQPPPGGSSHLQFTNNTPFWNASAPVNDARSGFFSGLSNTIPATPSFDEKPKVLLLLCMCKFFTIIYKFTVRTL